jgi:dUTP pyrophosphatase
MFKKKVKLKIHNPKCDFRQEGFQNGNCIDLAIAENLWVDAPKTQVAVSKKEEEQIVVFNDQKISLGVSMTLPTHYGAIIKPRSSTFGKHGLLLSNSVGEIEASYSGTWLAHVIPYKKTMIEAGTRLFQFQIYLLPTAPWYKKLLDIFVSGFKFKEVDVLTTTRGGFGSTN